MGRRQGRATQRLRRAELCRLRRSIRYLECKRTLHVRLCPVLATIQTGRGTWPVDSAATCREARCKVATTMGSPPCLRTIPDVLKLVVVPGARPWGPSSGPVAGDHGEIEAPRPVEIRITRKCLSASCLPSCAAVATQPRSPRHRTKVRHRRDLWFVSCSCDWSEETVSRFSALMALRRHQDLQGMADLKDPLHQL